MLKTNIIKKVLVPNSFAQTILPECILLLNIMAMYCANVFRDKMPLFIIIPQMVKILNELDEFQHRYHAIFAGTNNGWQTRVTFLWFYICFVNFLLFFRTKLDSNIRDKTALLILDGHKSREYLIGIHLLKQYSIEVFVLPSNTSHLNQMFDMEIGSPIKTTFSSQFNKLMEYFTPELNQAAQLRQFCVHAAL